MLWTSSPPWSPSTLLTGSATTCSSWRSTCKSPIPGGDCHCPRIQSEGPLQQPLEGLCHPCGCDGMQLRLHLCLILGPTRLAHSQQVLPTRDSIYRSKCHHLCQFTLHFHDCLGLSLHALSLQVLILQEVALDYALFCATASASDEECVDWGDDGKGVEVILAMQVAYWARWWIVIWWWD